MSAYASLPGSFLPPFFAFGAPTASDDDGGASAKAEGQKEEVTADTCSVQVQPNTAQPTEAAVESSLQSLDLKCKGDNLEASVPSPAPSRPKDIIIAFRSARVDPRALLKSLTSTGGDLARRTANFIASSASDGASRGDCLDDSEAGKADDAASAFSSPGLCYEDTDSDEEYSMYDYSDDFSTPHSELHEEPHSADASNRDEDPSAIEFELSITFQGRKYNATRAFPTFVQLRNDLLREFNGNGEGDTKHTSRFNRGRRTGISKSSSEPTLNHSENKEDACRSRMDAVRERVSVPELPRVSHECLGHAGFALSGVARSGFALLQATAQHYCPEMERWMREVVSSFPCSQALSSFLWEPLSSSNESWGTIGEGREHDSSTGGGKSEATASLSKPPLHSRSKPKSNLTARFKSKGSLGSRSASSLGSIAEGGGIDCDDHSL